MDYADSELALSAGQIKHAQFWFINKTPVDGIAFNHLTSGNIDSAIIIWGKSPNCSSLQNLFVCYLIKDDYQAALNTAVTLYNQYAEDLVAIIDEKATISINTLIQTVVDTISSDGIDLLPISKSISDNKWKKIIEEKKIKPLISQLNSHVSEAKATKDKGASARLTAGNKLKIATKPLLATLHRVLPLDDTRYQMIADKIAQEVLQCSIDYYNDTDDVDSPAKALPLCEYAKAVAVGNAAKQRCDQNYDVIKEAYDNMPPKEVANEAKEINNLLTWYAIQAKTSKKALELLKKAQAPLVTIKEKVGKTNSYYLETSSILGSAALSNVIDEVNNAQKEDKPNPLEGLFGTSSVYSIYSDILGAQERRRQKALKIKAALHDAWEAIVHIDLLDKTEDFNKNRYQPNRKTLYSIINGVKGFDYPDSNYILTGCAHGISANKKFFWCDSEFYGECTSKNEYNGYLQRFPNGNHVEEAKKRLAEIEERDKKIRKYILIAIAIAIILFLIIFSANGKSTSSSNYRSTPAYSSGYYDNSDLYESEDNDSYSDDTDEEDDNNYNEDDYDEDYDEEDYADEEEDYDYDNEF